MEIPLFAVTTVLQGVGKNFIKNYLKNQWRYSNPPVKFTEFLV